MPDTRVLFSQNQMKYAAIHTYYTERERKKKFVIKLRLACTRRKRINKESISKLLCNKNIYENLSKWQKKNSL